MSADDASSAMLSEMSECAYRLGMVFGREAERVTAWERKLQLFNLFDRCFFSVRVATVLQLRLRRAPAAAAREKVSDAEDLCERGDPPETEGLERERLDADRDREAEGASLPLLLKTLKAVAADAAALPGPAPAELPTLRELLAQVAPDPRPTPRPAADSLEAGGLRARLAGSATATVGALGNTLARPAGLSVARPPLRAATGPPRR